MQKLLLSSISSNIMSDFVKFAKLNPADIKIAFVPTAADNYEDKSFVIRDRDDLVTLGFDVFDVDLNNQNYESLNEVTKDVDIIFVAGGNVFYLLEKVLESGFH